MRFLRTDGSLGPHLPLRVLSDDGRQLWGWLPQDCEILGIALPDGRDPREAPLEERFRLPRILVPSRWRHTSTLRWIDDCAWSSVWWLFSEGRFLGWYVNLEIPLGRTATSVDRVDEALDLVVAPDRSWQWKDEDELLAAVAAGRYTPEQVDALRAEGLRMIARAQAAQFPFDGSWCDFRPDPAWPFPQVL